MDYIDGYVLAVPTANRDRYRDLAEKAAAGSATMARCRSWNAGAMTCRTGRPHPFQWREETPDETVVFSWTVWPSKEVRDEAWSRMMSDPDFADMGEMPFDGKRMIYGGFVPLVRALITRRGPAPPPPPTRPAPRRKTGRQQVAARRGLPVQHLAAREDPRQGAQFQPRRQRVRADTARDRDRLVQRRGPASGTGSALRIAARPSLPAAGAELHHQRRRHGREAQLAQTGSTGSRPRALLARREATPKSADRHQIETQRLPLAQRARDSIDAAALQSGPRSRTRPARAAPATHSAAPFTGGRNGAPMRRPVHAEPHVRGRPGRHGHARGQPRDPGPVRTEPRPARPAQRQHRHLGRSRRGPGRLEPQALRAEPRPAPARAQLHPGSASRPSQARTAARPSSQPERPAPTSR